MDLLSHQVYIESQRTKKDRANCFQPCSDAGKPIGLPDFLQLDNELSFRGSNQPPQIAWLGHSALSFIFVFNRSLFRLGNPGVMARLKNLTILTIRNFFAANGLPAIYMLKRQSKNFQRFHNRHHRYSCLKGKTPLEVIEKDGSSSQSKLVVIRSCQNLKTVPDGNIILIRFIRSNRMLDIFGEKFKVSKNLSLFVCKSQ